MAVGTPGAIRQPPASSGNFGQGISYPLSYNAQGRLTLSYGPTSVEQALQAIWETGVGERAMLPKYGADTGTFEPTDLDRMIIRFRQNVAEYEPRVESVDITTSDGPGQGEVSVQVAYTLVGEANERTLTFPFFVGP